LWSKLKNRENDWEEKEWWRKIHKKMEAEILK